MVIPELVEQLSTKHDLNDAKLKMLFETDSMDEALFSTADKKRRDIYGDEVYIRGLIEFTNYCKNNCYYCGIRRDNTHAERYRLSKEEILACCAEGYLLGFRTFVLQGGEDPYYTDDRVCELVSEIRSRYPDCAITLSIGEKSRESYQAFFNAGANRYLLRHETANEQHYRKLHPDSMRLQNRKRCLYDLKEIGYQVGSGFMVGSPYQTTENLIEDLRFLQELQPHMTGIGPYITHAETPFASFRSGSLALTLRLVREIPPSQSYVVSFTHISGGNAWNIIPETAFCEGTARTFRDQGRRFIRDSFSRIVRGFGEMTGTACEVEWISGPPAVINDRALCEAAKATASEAGLNAVDFVPEMISDDFSFFTEQTVNARGLYLKIGTGIGFPLHHPKFRINLDAIAPTVELISRILQKTLA